MRFQRFCHIRSGTANQHTINLPHIILILIVVFFVFYLVWRISFWLVDKFWWNINILNDVSTKKYQEAEKAAGVSNPGILPSLKTTESEPRWALLYEHAQMAQISPETMRHMKRVDLEYLAGMAFPHPDLAEPQRTDEDKKDAEKRHEKITKLMGNVTRATIELDKRTAWRTTFFTAGGVILGGILGAMLATS